MATEDSSSYNSRFIVGIDLGTTNCSLSYIDIHDEARRVKQLPVPQLVAPGEVASDVLLPSFCYLPGPHELPEDALKLPWHQEQTHAVGRFAREQGSRIPERMVASAKSWLAHAGVARTNPILPWGGDLAEQMVSPVQVSRFYLEHLKNAWNASMGRKRDQDGSLCLLQDQQVVVTVPASFDEVARELTIQAARLAGISKLTLIEEPLSAFYSWLAFHESDWQNLVKSGDIVVVMDVGGGTTDFSLIEIDDKCTLRRKAVGDHLLLGGDNMDMALAHQAETHWKARLSQRQWTMLCQECRRAKECLLDANAPESFKIQLAGLGSSVVSSVKTFTFTKDNVEKLILDGFFTPLDVDAPPPERRRGIQEMGLPYAADPTVTKHLLQFLRYAGKTLSTPADMAKPTKLLFNGGTMIPASIRKHVLDMVAKWTGNPDVAELVPSDFSLAVSEGAAYYGLARRGEAVRVKGGIANAYFLEIKDGDHRRQLCVMPRDTEEGIVCKLTHPFELQTNTPVAFPLCASSTRLEDKLGDMLDTTDDMTHLPPLHTSLRFGKSDQKTTIQVTLASRLNEIGTLEIWCQATQTEHRFPLTFELRDAASPDASQAQLQNNTTLDDACVQAALTCIDQTFQDSPENLESLTRKLEEIFGLQRQEWPAFLLRNMADTLIQNPDWRKASPAHETRWLNLLSFCIRPGFGLVGDEDRVRRIWKLWHHGTLHDNNRQTASNWWILWRRLAGGLSAGQQNQIAGMLAHELIAKDLKTVIKPDDVVTLEKWRLLSTLERIPVNLKLKCLNALINGSGRLDNAAFWPIARLIARTLFAGTQDTVIPAAKIQPLVDPLIQKARQARTPHNALLALASAARQTAIRTIDLDDASRAKIAAFLNECNAPDYLCQQLNQSDNAQKWQDDILGDSLPLGLSLAN